MSRLSLALFSSSLVALAAIGCGSSTDSASSPEDAAVDVHTDEAAVVHDADDAAPAPDTAPPVCWFLKSARPEERKCDDCSDVTCKTERETCFGPHYQDGTFGGVCEDYIKCQCGCNESDDVCQQACKIMAPQACDDCVKKVSDCENTKCASTCAPGL